MADIFLSYAREDEPRARRLTEALNACGWTVWWDAELSSSDRYRKVIDQELQAARCVLVLWSRRSIDSDWVVEEAEDGKIKGVLVQVLLDDVSPPRGFRQIHWANLASWDGEPRGREFLALHRGISRFVPLPEREPLVHGAAIERPEPAVELSANRQAQEFGLSHDHGPYAEANLHTPDSAVRTETEDLNRPSYALILGALLGIATSFTTFIVVAASGATESQSTLIAVLSGALVAAALVIYRTKDIDNPTA